MASAADDVWRILSYLELEPGAPEIERIVGLPTEELARLLRDEPSGGVDSREHIRVVATIVGILEEARLAATGTVMRGRPATHWLNHARIQTRAGIKSPIEILSDETLAREVLDDLSR